MQILLQCMNACKHAKMKIVMKCLNYDISITEREENNNWSNDTHSLVIIT